MMLASLAFAAVLGGQDAMPVIAPRQQDRRADCPAWLVQAVGGPASGTDACLWTDSSDAAQAYYVGALREAGWLSAGGVANALKFRKGGSCLAMAGFPAAKPESEAIGSERDLRQPRPADRAAVFLIVPDEPGSCTQVGDH
ncbi:hypothetical protein [Brevundimonas sp.]|uniref:hypothetical protein n=1 Tax=Brevundimonas sp. TaxID=1871086 RepID=UPI002FC581CB